MKKLVRQIRVHEEKEEHRKNGIIPSRRRVHEEKEEWSSFSDSATRYTEFPFQWEKLPK